MDFLLADLSKRTTNGRGEDPDQSLRTVLVPVFSIFILLLLKMYLVYSNTAIRFNYFREVYFYSQCFYVSNERFIPKQYLPI